MQKPTAASRFAPSHQFHEGNPLAERNALRVMILTIVMMVFEIAGGWYYNSMALLADGWHMSSHALALGLAVAAYSYARKLASDQRFTFGTWKIEVLGGYTSALMLVLIAIIDRQGIGSGLWVLFLAAPLAALPLQMAQLSDAYIAGQYAGLGILLGGAFAVLTVAAITALLLAWGYATGTAETLIWSPLIAYTALPWVLIAIALAFSGGNADAAQVMLTSVPWLLPLVITVLLLLSAFLYVREQRRAGVDTPVDVPVLGLTLAAVGISGELIGRQYYGALPLSETQWIVATVVATTLLFEAGVLGRKSPAGEAQSSPRNR